MFLNKLRSSPPFAGLDTFQYNVCTDSSRTNCATGTVVVTVQIDANDDFFDVRMNSANNELNVFSNEPGGGDLTKFTISAPPTSGTASISNNVILYTPTTSFTGRDTFQYKICASAPANNCDFATVTIRVNITATDDVFNFNQNTGLHQLGVTANDGSTFAEFRLGTPSVGVATINYQGGGVVAFQVPSNWAGTVTFTYTICAEAGCVENTATATVTVNIQLIVIDDHFTVTQGVTNNLLDVLNNDPGGGALSTFAVVSQTTAKAGTATISSPVVRYDPKGAPNAFAGLDTFQYRICAVGFPSNCATGTVTVTVLITATADTVTVNMNSAITFNPLANDLGSNASLQLVQITFSSLIIVNEPFCTELKRWGHKLL